MLPVIWPVVFGCLARDLFHGPGFWIYKEGASFSATFCKSLQNVCIDLGEVLCGTSKICSIEIL